MHARKVGARKACDNDNTQWIMYSGHVFAGFDVDRLRRSELWSAPLFKCLLVPSPIGLVRTMATRSGDIVDLIGEMTIAGHTPSQIYS